MMKFEPAFDDPSNNNNQYTYEERTEEAFVEAKYRNTGVNRDADNIFICALPFPRTEDQVYRDYSKSIDIPGPEKLRTLSKEYRERLLNNIMDVRIPLNYQRRLEVCFYNTLVNSYNKRRLVLGPNSHVTIQTEQGIQVIPAKLTVKKLDGTDCGVALLGFSGTGKSTTSKTLLENYPQVIEHILPNGDKYKQVVYLFVECTENEDFTTLVRRIAIKLDEALGISPYCVNEIKRSSRSGQMTDKLSELVQTFSVGTIIIDEIQEMDFKSNTRGTFNNIMTLANETKVGLVVIGTELAFEKMFTNQWVLRRVGNLIHANDYCQDRIFFKYVLKQYLKYQYLDVPIKLTDSLENSLYENSSGNISLLRNLLIKIQETCLESENYQPDIDPALIDKIADDNYPGSRIFMQRQIDPIELVSADILDQQKKYNETAKKSIKQAIKAEEAETNSDPAFDLFSYVYNYISVRTNDYNQDTIKKVFEAVWKNQKYRKLPFDDISETVYKRLKRRSRSDKRSDSPSPLSMEERRKELGLDNDISDAV